MPNLETSRDQFLDFLRVERSLSVQTLEAYGNDLRGFIHYHGNQEVKNITHQNVVDWLMHLGSMHLAASSQQRALSAIRQFFLYLQRQKYCEHNPTDNIQNLKKKRELPHVVTMSDINKILDIAKDNATSLEPRHLRDHAALELLYGAGLRVSELCLLRLDEVHFNLGVLKPRGKGNKDRMVPMGSMCQQVLQHYLEYGRKEFLRGYQSQYVLLGPKAKPLTRMGMYKIVRRYGLLAGLAESLSPHDLRHAFATHMLKGGADLRSVQEMLGHANISTTEIYTHVMTDDLRATVDKHHPLGAAKITLES